MHDDLVRDMKTMCLKADFHEKMKEQIQDDCSDQGRKDLEASKAKFEEIAVTASQDMVTRFDNREPVWYHSNVQFAEAVSTASKLPTLANQSYKMLVRLRMRLLEEARARGPEEVQHRAAVLCAMQGITNSEGQEALHQPVVEGGSESPLFERIKDGDTKAVQLLIHAKVNIEAKNEKNEGKTPLLEMAPEGSAVAVKTLLEFKADVEATSKDGYDLQHQKVGPWPVVGGV